MTQPTDSLLQPSLSTDRPAVAIYSTKATFFTSLFGGHVAALIIGALNARHMGRLREDAPRLIGIGLASHLAMIGVLLWAMDADVGRPTMRTAGQLLGVMVWGAIYLQHRPVYRAAKLAEAAHRPGWKAGIACVLASAVLQAGYVLLFFQLVSTP